MPNEQYIEQIMVADGDGAHPSTEDVKFETVPHDGISPDLNALSLSTNTPVDANEIITKEGSTWYRKTFGKVWDYIKGKIASVCGRIIIDLQSETPKSAGEVGELLRVKFKNADGSNTYQTSPICFIGTDGTDTYNAGVSLGSRNGTTYVSAGESSNKLPGTTGKYNDENLYLTADGRVQIITNSNNEGTSYNNENYFNNGELFGGIGYVKSLGANYVMNYTDFTHKGFYKIDSLATNDTNNPQNAPVNNVGDYWILATYGGSIKFQTLILLSPRLNSNAIYIGSFWNGVWQGWKPLTQGSDNAYGTCGTAADVAEKVVTVTDSNWTLKVGSIVAVKFTNTNTASNCTLNVNNTGAKSIWYNNAVYTAAGTWQAGTANRYIYYMYDGTYWVWMGHSIDADGNNATRQYPTNTTNADYRVLLSYGANDNDETNLTRKDKDFKYNPSTNNLMVGKINGNDASTAGILSLLHPIGTIIESTTCDTMEKVVAAYGGTKWIQHEGYVLRGATSNVTAGTQGQTNDGGADSVSVSSVASHNHTQNSHNHSQNAHNHSRNEMAFGNVTLGNSGSYVRYNFDNIQYTNYSTATNNAETATNQAKGATYSLATLPKYKNVYIWERTA